MRFLVVTLVAVGGYYLWTYFAAPEEPAPVVAEEPAPPPVEFAIKMRVKRILEEWKRQSLVHGSNPKPMTMLDMKAEINEIRRRLYDRGLHDGASLQQTMVQAAVELGYAPDQANYLVAQVLVAN